MKECSIHPFFVVGALGCPRCNVEQNPLKPRGRMPKRSKVEQLEEEERDDELEPHDTERLLGISARAVSVPRLR